MKNIRILCMSIFLMTLLFLTLCSMNPEIVVSKEPVIEFSEMKYNFGSVKEGTVVKHIFILKNTGDDILKIIRVDSPWGCTAALLSKREIPAGGQGKIEVKFNSARRIGKVMKTIKIYSNDPKRKIVKLVITGRVVGR